jgi:hypothetical protein
VVNTFENWQSYVDIAEKALGPILDYETFKTLGFNINYDVNQCTLALTAVGAAYHHGLEYLKEARNICIPDISQMKWDDEPSTEALFRLCTLLATV